MPHPLLSRVACGVALAWLASAVAPAQAQSVAEF